MLTQFNFQSIFWQFKNYISVFHFWDQLFKARLTGGRRSIIWGGHIFIYLCSQTLKPIDLKKITCTEHEYMNMGLHMNI